MRIAYSAVQRFDPGSGEAWQKFIDWSGLTQLREVISLDGILCSAVFPELSADDWQHNIHEDFKTNLFYDLDYVLRKVAGQERVDVLAVIEAPTMADLVSFADPRFVFRGFDLVDHCGGVSALVNCGGFIRAFASSDLSDCGLLTDHAKALKVQSLLRAEYPDEHHAECDLWAIWKMNLPTDRPSVIPSG